MAELIVDLSEAKKFLDERNAKSCIVQIPEGLKDKTTWIIDELTSNCGQVYVKMDPCYGACDLPLNDMKVLNADCIIHIGHGPIHKHNDIMYLACYYELNEDEIAKNAKRLLEELQKRGAKNVSLIANVQYQPALAALRKILLQNKISVHDGHASRRIAVEGQVLGCNYTAVETVQEEIDANIYFGDGYFHPMGLVFSTKKPVIVVNPLHGTVEEISEKNRERFMRKRFAAIAKAQDAKTFGIMVSVKSGQRQKEKALELKKKIEEHGKKAYLLEMDLVVENYMMGVKVDCLVNTACNRIVLDDAQNWKRLILNPTEALIAIGERKWENWSPDEFLH